MYERVKQLLEEADQGSRYLDGEILKLLRPWLVPHPEYPEWVLGEEGLRHGKFDRIAPLYTTCPSGAFKLLPDDWDWEIKKWFGTTYKVHMFRVFDTFNTKHNDLLIAITLAGLRAQYEYR